MALYSYSIGEQFNGTGSATVAASATAVAGSSADFENEFDVGDLLIVNGQTRVVGGVTGSNTMKVTQTWTASATAAVVGVDLTNVEDLTNAPAAPRSQFTESSVYVPLGDGTTRGAGWPTAKWRWGYLTQAQRDDLRAYCTGASNSLYICTRENDTSDQYNYYTCTMIWPLEEEKDHGKRLDFVVEFQNLSAVSVS